MKDLKEREREAREQLAERLKRLRVEMSRRPAAASGARRGRIPVPVTEPEPAGWWWQR
jgi:hypothetical protein